MRRTNAVWRGTTILAVAVLALVVSGCRGGGKSGKPGTAAGGNGGAFEPLGPGHDIAVTERDGMAGGTWKAGQFEAVYFDFDSARVRPSELPKIEAVAKSAKGKQLVVEGHADERGTAEYNRALAERRALACREELIRLGLHDEDITTISYGEERPRDAGHDETAWAKNRRCEFIIVTQ